MERKKKWLLVTMTALSFCFPPQALAEEANTQVGVGFSQEYRVTIPNTIGRYNVIPLTTTRYTTRQGTDLKSNLLPKTGTSINRKLQLIGIACLFMSFWLFLFLRLKKEGDYE